MADDTYCDYEPENKLAMEILEGKPSLVLSEDYSEFTNEQLETEEKYWTDKTKELEEMDKLKTKGAEELAELQTKYWEEKRKYVEKMAALEGEKHEAKMKYIDEQGKELKEKIKERKEVFELKRKYWEQKDLAMKRKYWRTVIEKDNIKQKRRRFK
jgi:hypothetical protein